MIGIFATAIGRSGNALRESWLEIRRLVPHGYGS